MLYIYYLFICIAHIISAPILLLLTFKQKYKTSIKRRFFIPNNHANEHYDIWLHACSFGEITSIKSLIDNIPQTKRIFLTTITNTGYSQAKNLYGNRKNIYIDYLAFESLLPFVAPKCELLLVFEAELWLMLFAHAKQKGAKTKLVNARISTRSEARYYKFRYFYAYLFSYIDNILAQSIEDKSRLDRIGAKHIQSIGNIKILNKPIITKHYNIPKRLVIIAASTHINEESLILQSYKNFLQSISKDSQNSTILNNYLHNATNNANYITKDSKNPPLLIIVPRHPERFNEVYEICAKQFSVIKYTNIDTLHIDSIKEDILLIDTMGELINLYAISDIVILCGSFEPIGGHNPIEVASFRNVLISGKEIFNQHALFALIKDYYLLDSNTLSDALISYKSLHISSIDSNATKDIIDIILS